MEKRILEALEDRNENYILPFLWMKGESEETLRREIARIDSCGIKALCLESRPHPDFCGPRWWKDLSIVLEEAKKREMKVWILDDAHFPTGMANGLLAEKYPERAKKYLAAKRYDVTGPRRSCTLDLTLSMQRDVTWMDLGKPVEKPLMDEKKAVSVVMKRMSENDMTAGEVVDLTDRIEGERLTFDIPRGTWRIFVIYTTFDEGARNDYINIIDEKSVQVLIEAVYESHYEHFREEFGKTILGFFSDEPGFGNTFGFAMDEKLGEKQMPLPWSVDMPEELRQRLGDGYERELYLLFGDDEERLHAARVRYAYMDAVTMLYRRNFSEQLGKWCEERNVSYIGHVIEDNNEHSHLGSGAGHYFRAMNGQHMAGIDTIGSQILPGNPNTFRHGFGISDGKFYHYSLAPLAASSAAFDPMKKGQSLCECFGAYGWRFGVRDMKWVADHLLSRGINHLVPHAFSMAPFPDEDCPPHFYAGGKNPEFLYFGRLMRYCNRLCHIFSGGKWLPEVGILYDAEADWCGRAMRDQSPAEILYDHHIGYGFVPCDAFSEAERYETVFSGGKLSINGISLTALIVPECQFLDGRVAAFIRRYPEFPVIFVGSLPEGLTNISEEEEAGAMAAVRDCTVSSLAELYVTLRRCHVNGAPVVGRGWEIPSSFLHYLNGEHRHTVMIFNESMDRELSGELTYYLDEEGTRIYGYDAMKNRVIDLPQIPSYTDNSTVLQVSIPPYSSLVIFGAKPEEAEPYLTEPLPDNPMDTMDISSGWEVSVAGAAEDPSFESLGRMEELRPISELRPRFSGFMRYGRSISLARGVSEAVLTAEHVYEVGRVFVDGEERDFSLTPPYRFSLGALSEGEHSLVMECANTPARDVLNYRPGMMGHEKGVYEPSGIFGKITVSLYR